METGRCGVPFFVLLVGDDGWVVMCLIFAVRMGLLGGPDEVRVGANKVARCIRGLCACQRTNQNSRQGVRGEASCGNAQSVRTRRMGQRVDRTADSLSVVDWRWPGFWVACCMQDLTVLHVTLLFMFSITGFSACVTPWFVYRMIVLNISWGWRWI